MRVLFAGDVIAKKGRAALRSGIDGLRADLDLIIVNGENSAGGFGITQEVAAELFSMGADVITSGNHIWDKKETFDFINDEPRLLRPINYPPGVPGQGLAVVNTKTGRRIGVVNASGRVFMSPMDCPFRALDAALVELKGRVDAVIVDFHAEATSEKIAMGWYLDGRVSAVVGTHTHVQTADERVLPGGTAYITDVGMTGPRDSVIGVKTETIINRFLYQTPSRFETAGGPQMFSAVLVEIDDSTGRAISIERILKEQS